MNKFNSWQKISAIVGILSFGWVLLQWSQEKTKNQAMSSTLINQVRQIYDLQGKINMHNKQKHTLQLSLDSLIAESSQNRSLAAYWRSQAKQLNKEIEHLKSQLNEKPPFVFSNDSTELEFFLRWTE